MICMTEEDGNGTDHGKIGIKKGGMFWRMI